MEKKPITTNTVQPIQPFRPENGEYAKAKGPMITTGNIERIKSMNAASVEKAKALKADPTPKEKKPVAKGKKKG